MKKILSYLLFVLGIIIFIFCITGEIDGVGRAACIFSGTIFSVSGFLLKKN